ncbi:ribonuclease H-like domain-containing protein [Tanacetum coccineum]
MVEGYKPPKNKGVSSISKENNIDQYDPLFLHSNDTNKVPIIGFKLEEMPEEAGFMQEQWDRCNSVVFNWIPGCVSQDVFMGQVFSKIAKSVLALSEYYHKFNALWRAYDSLVDLPDCIYDVYAPIRSIILTTDPIPDVKGAFATFSKDESHRSTQSHNVSKIGNGNSTFMARTNNRSNNWYNFNNNQNKRLNKPNLLCTHCNMNGHTADRCFELVGYAPNFKKRNGSNQGGSGNAATPVAPLLMLQDSVLKTQVGTSSKSNGLYFLHTGYQAMSEKSVFVGYSFDKKGYKLYSLESKKMVYSRDVKFYKIVFPFKHSSECKEYEMVYQKTNNLNFFDLDDNYNSDDPYDDGRDKEFDISEGIDPTLSREATSGVEENVTHEENDKESEGDDSFYQEFNEMLQPTNDIPDRWDNVNLRRSSRKAGMPAKLSDFHIDTKVKYNIDKHVNYSKWVEAMKALNRNNTWIITDLSPGRKAIGGKWVFKVKYKSSGDVERFKARYMVKGYNQKEGIDYEETLVSWKSKKQSVLAKSSAEAEYRAMNIVTCEVIWIMKIMNELNVKVALPVTVNCDNSSIIHHERTKHFEIELFFLREKVVARIIKTVKVKSEENMADIFTKGLSVVDHNKFCNMLKLKDLYHN